MKVEQRFKLHYYSEPDGRKPFEEWLNSISEKHKSTIQTRLIRVQLGNLGDKKYLDDGVFELRQLNINCRIYFGFDIADKSTILLLCGGYKSSKKIQKRDIKRAKEYWRRYTEGSNK